MKPKKKGLFQDFDGCVCVSGPPVRKESRKRQKPCIYEAARKFSLNNICERFEFTPVSVECSVYQIIIASFVTIAQQQTTRKTIIKKEQKNIAG